MLNQEKLLRIKSYITGITKNYFNKQKIKHLEVYPLDSEKERIFRLDINNKSYILKINFYEEDNLRNRAFNEATILKLLQNNGIKNVPRLYYYDTIKKFDSEETLIINFIENDRKAQLEPIHIKELIDFLFRIQSIQSKYFTIPYGDINKKYSGTSYDFVNKYFDVIKNDFLQIKKLKNCQKINRILSHFIYFIENEIHRNKNILEKTSEFHLLHGHLARNNERKHILINNKKIFIVDWEGALFGDKEYEIAAFLYENDTLPLERKKNFLNEYLNRETISKRKLKIYKFLIRLDDFAESIKKYLFKKERAEAKDIYSLNKEIISLEKEIALW